MHASHQPSDLLAASHWELAGTRPGAIDGPGGLSRLTTWMSVAVPGTVAGALRDHYGDTASRTMDIDGQDWWWRTTVEVGETDGPWILVADGLATIADVWVNGTVSLHSENMFCRVSIELCDLVGTTEIVIRCAALLPVVTARLPRPRWKSSLVAHQGWRWLRTSLLGRIEGWGKGAPPVGPWRPVRLHRSADSVIMSHRIAACLDGETGVVQAKIITWGPAPVTAWLRVGNVRTTARIGADSHVISAEVRIPGAALWWPHTHGPQHLYEVTLELDDQTIVLPRIGFRQVSVETADGQFTITVNGTAIFARGACWTPLDPVGLRSTPDAILTAVTQARRCGLNILRVTGTMMYEDESFYAACDEAGVLVWQDCMLASLDPPDTQAFSGEIATEVAELADRLVGHPCLAVISGSSELTLQPALLGLPDANLPVPVIDEVIAAVVADRLPGIPYLPSTPPGGLSATLPRSGVAHYFGVGAYLRPLDDVRTAGVRFAAECLAFSIPPESDSVREFFATSRGAGHDPGWKVGVPRDGRSSWDFEDIRDQYVRDLFHLDPMLVRYSDPDLYLDLGRAAVCIAMSEVLTEWRRPESGCSGSIILALRDLVPGAGWGIVDARGQPKAPWYVLRRILDSTAVLVSDDGLNGITVTLVNDSASDVTGDLALTVWSVHGVPAHSAVIPVTVPARSATAWPLDTAIGYFTDSSHAYRFGPKTNDMMRACLMSRTGVQIADVVVLLGNHLRPMRRGGLSGRLEATESGWVAEVAAEKICQWVSLSAVGYQPSDSWFHLAPGMTRRIRLEGHYSTVLPPVLSIRALNVEETVVVADAESPAVGSVS